MNYATRLAAALISAIFAELAGGCALLGLAIGVHALGLPIRVSHSVVVLVILSAPPLVAALVGWRLADHVMRRARYLRRILSKYWVA